MRVIFSTSDPLRTLIDLQTTISFKKFMQYLEMLDAKATIDEDTRNKEAEKAKKAQQGK